MMTRNYLALTASILFGLAAFTTAAEATQVCAPRDQFVTALAEKYQENRHSMGLSGKSAVIELFVSTAGDWTLMATDTKGVACVIAAGEAWQDAPRAVAGQDS